jgi:hypothetical protein
MTRPGKEGNGRVGRDRAVAGEASTDAAEQGPRHPPARSRLRIAPARLPTVSARRLIVPARQVIAASRASTCTAPTSTI